MRSVDASSWPSTMPRASAASGGGSPAPAPARRGPHAVEQSRETSPRRRRWPVHAQQQLAGDPAAAQVRGVVEALGGEASLPTFDASRARSLPAKTSSPPRVALRETRPLRTRISRRAPASRPQATAHLGRRAEGDRRAGEQVPEPWTCAVREPAGRAVDRLEPQRSRRRAASTTSAAASAPAAAGERPSRRATAATPAVRAGRASARERQTRRDDAIATCHGLREQGHNVPRAPGSRAASGPSRSSARSRSRPPRSASVSPVI